MKNIKRSIAVFIVCLLLISCVPAVSAADDSLTYGDFKYTVNNGEVTVTEYIGEDANMVIPSEIEGMPVRRIGSYAFSNNKTFTSAKISDSVTDIGNDAFEKTSLESIVVPDSVTLIGIGAFMGCEKLKTAVISENVKQISSNMFNECSSLETVSFSSETTSFGERAFAFCVKLKKINIPNTVTSIGEGCFDNCILLEDVQIPLGVTKISKEAFQNCCGIKSIVIPDSVTTIENSAFERCSSLESLTLSKRLKEIKMEAFQRCTSLKKIDIPDSVTTCMESAFRDCYSVTEIKIGSKLSVIPKFMFFGCSALKSIELPETVTQIKTNALNNCQELKKVYILNSKAQIATHGIGFRYVSYDNYEVYPNTTIYGYYDSTAENYAQTNKMKFVELSTNPAGVHTVIKLDTDTLNVMQYRKRQIKFTVENPGGGTRFESTDPEIVTVDKNGVIEAISIGTAYIAITNTDAAAVVQVNVTEPDVDIKHEHQNDEYKYFYADDDNEKVYVRITEYIGSGSEVVIPSKINGYPVKAIGEEAFSEGEMNDIEYAQDSDTRPRITRLVIPEGVERLERAAFYGCAKLKSVKFPSTIKYVGESLFYGEYYNASSSIEVVEFPSAEAFVKYMATAADAADYAHVNQDPITNEVFTEPINTAYALPTYAPYTLLVNGKEVTDVEIPEEITTVPDYLFYNCKSIKRVTLPDGIEKIGRYAFYNCKALTSVELPASVNAIDDYAFYGCASLADVDLPEYLKALGRYSYSRSGIKSVTIPETAAVNRCAFEDCKSLKTVFFNSKNKSCQLYGFIDGCDALEAFTIGYNAVDIKSDALTRITGSPTFYVYYNNTLYFVCRQNNLSYSVLPFPWEGEEPQNNESDLPSIPVYPNYFYDADTQTYTVTDKEGAISGEGAYPNEEAWNAKTVVFDFDSEVCLTLWCAQWFRDAENIVVKGNVLEIDNNPFHLAADSVRSVELSDNVRSIGTEAFINCEHLTTIKGGKGIKNIGREAFANCTGLTDLDFASSVEHIGYGAFWGCKSLLGITLPDALTKIGDYAFVNCTGMAEVEIPSTVTEIGNRAFGYKYNTEQNEYYPVPEFTIITDKGSAAEKYAVDNNFKIRYRQSEVVPTTVKKPKLSYSKLSLNAGKLKTLKVVNGKIKAWKSSDSKIASVKSGKVTALQKGKATITAILKTGKKLTCKVTVKNSPKLSKSTVSVKKGKTVSVKLTGKATAIRNTYTNTKLAKIISKKTATALKIKGLRRGTTTLKIKVNGVKTLRLRVKVK